ADGKKLSTRELRLPLLLIFLGLAIMIPSIPGQGNTGLIAFGMSLSFVGTAIAKKRITKRNDNSPE
ncbi:hypothetical protein KC959_01775, partial [Candidatus Saccharibacteria bacterium]|nr:hypothetical protein [Candidatus Saccharibacteria bacterium]